MTDRSSSPEAEGPDAAWTRAAILDFVRGHRALACGMYIEPQPMPDWIAEVCAEVVPFTAAEVLDAAHPADRGRLTQQFVEVLGRPGEILDIAYRCRLGEQWMGHEVRLLNLLDHELGVVLAVLHEHTLDDDEVPEADDGQAGQHDTAPWMLNRLDPVGRFIASEGEVETIMGRTADEILGHFPMEFLHPDSCADVIPMWLRLLEQPGNTATSRRCMLRPDGTELWVESNYLNRIQPDGSGDVLMVTRDITAPRAQNEELRRSHADNVRLAEEARLLAEDFRLLADHVPAAVFRCDEAGAVSFHNARWPEMFGEGQVRLHDVVHPDDHLVIDAELTRLASTDGPDEHRTIEVRATDRERILAVTCRSLADERAGHHRIVGSIDDVTATVRLHVEVRHDDLTGLLNRKALDEVLEAALRDDRTGTLVMFIDLDGFKAVNDVYGHDAGDAVLREVGRRLGTSTRPEDAVGRYGGDEFVVVCRDTTESDQAAIAERLAHVFDTPITFADGSWHPRASIGSARPGPGDSLATVLREADLEMLAVKRQRRAGTPVPTHH